jgi:hypothetical protein
MRLVPSLLGDGRIRHFSVQDDNGVELAQLPNTANGYRSAAAFTRPANTTGYTAGDVLGGAGSPDADPGSAILEFASVGPSGGYILIASADLRVDLTAVPSGMTSFRLHLYDASPTAILDNAAWDLPSGDRSSYLGYVDLGAPVDVGSTLFVQTDQLNKPFKLASGQTSLWGELVTNGTYTPASGTVYTPRLHAMGL